MMVEFEYFLALGSAVFFLGMLGMFLGKSSFISLFAVLGVIVIRSGNKLSLLRCLLQSR